MFEKLSNDNFIMQAYKNKVELSKIAITIELTNGLDTLIEENNKRLNKLGVYRKNSK